MGKMEQHVQKRYHVLPLCSTLVLACKPLHLEPSIHRGTTSPFCHVTWWVFFNLWKLSPLGYTNQGIFFCPYGWWKKSCTTWDVQNAVNNGINYLSTGAGFLPSTVCSNKNNKRAITSVSPFRVGRMISCDNTNYITIRIYTQFLHKKSLVQTRL